MTPATKAGHLQMLSAVACIVGAFMIVFVLNLARSRWPEYEIVFAILFFVTIAVGMGSFFFVMFRWRTRCPNCRNPNAKFTHDKHDKEFLTCRSCGFSEETGFELD